MPLSLSLQPFPFSDDDFGTPMGNSQLGETDSSMRPSPPPPNGLSYLAGHGYPGPGTPPYLTGSPYPPSYYDAYHGAHNGHNPPPHQRLQPTDLSAQPRTSLTFPEFPPSPASWLDDVDGAPAAQY